jgi:preprotein translocase subunit YajC
VAKKKSSSSNYSFLIIIALFAVVYFGFIRPRSRKARGARTVGTVLAIGDRVMSIGGIYGTVVAIHDGATAEDSTVDVEVSPGVVLSFLRRAVNARPGPAVVAGDDDVHYDDDEAYDDDSFDAESGTYAEPEPYGDFDEHGEFHEHGHTPAHDGDAGHHSAADVEGAEVEDPDAETDDGPGQGPPGAAGGTGSEDD